MSNEHKKEYLRGYQRAKYELKRAEEDLVEYKTSILYPSTLLDNMPVSNIRTDLSKYMPKLEALSQKCIDRRYKAISVAEEIKERINELECIKEQEVLRLRYIRLKSWEQICVDMEYGWAQVHRFHGKALANLKHGIE